MTLNAERSLRSIVVGHNSWLFYGSDKGGRMGAVLNTVIVTCKRLRVDPFAYLRDLFVHIAAHPRARLDELLPDRWRQRRASWDHRTSMHRNAGKNVTVIPKSSTNGLRIISRRAVRSWKEQQSTFRSWSALQEFSKEARKSKRVS